VEVKVMPWQLLTLTIDRSRVEQLNEALELAGALSITLEDAQDEPIFELPPDTVLLWSRCKLTGLFEEGFELSPVVTSFEHQMNTPIESQITQLPDQDWERVCLDQFQPMCFGKRLWVSPSWRRGEACLAQAITVTLDPGLAFGTGSHPTTRLMLQWLDGADLTNKTVIDYGCGSGILAIAAAKLGAAKVIGIDYDPQALTATHNNAAENNVQIECYLPDMCPDIKADIILANIIVNPLIELMPIFVAHLKEGGSLILSGLLTEQRELLLSHLPASLRYLNEGLQEDWLRLDFMQGMPRPYELID
jgi:ribosomal protein L11 methyltransferase